MGFQGLSKWCLSHLRCAPRLHARAIPLLDLYQWPQWWNQVQSVPLCWQHHFILCHWGPYWLHPTTGWPGQGAIRPQSSQLAEPLWTDHYLNSGSSVRELISTPPPPTQQQTNKKRRQGMVQHSPQILGSQDSLLVRALDSWSKGCEFEGSVSGEFSSPELTLCANSYLVSILTLCYCSGT